VKKNSESLRSTEQKKKELEKAITTHIYSRKRGGGGKRMAGQNFEKKGSRVKRIDPS